jgi:hypothetical protein
MNHSNTHFNTGNSNHINNNDNNKFKFNSKYANILEHYGQWLLSIPRDDIPALMETPEYNLFQEAFHNLELAHRKTLLLHQKYHFQYSHTTKNTSGANGTNANASVLTSSSTTHTSICCVSFLQHLALDDIILRIFEFLPCETLVKTSETCHRFHILCKKSAKQRTVHMAGHYYLQNEMKLLRAKEQIEGIRSEYKPVVRVPLLGLARRVFVSGSGDEEFNGVYFCTGTNGNGFLFTKPRDQREWTRTRHDRDRNEMLVDEDNNSMIDGDHGHDELIDINNDNHHHHDIVVHDLNHHPHDFVIHDFDRLGNNNDQHLHRHHHQQQQQQQQAHHHNNNNNNNNRDLNDDDDGDETYPLSYYTVKKPRCIISKRFSNEVCTYMNIFKHNCNVSMNLNHNIHSFPLVLSFKKKYSRNKQTILWYMSKEIVDENGKMKQIFSFWAKLMVIDAATADICRYPSQTSILSRNGDPAWQSLSNTRNMTPPIVELID